MQALISIPNTTYPLQTTSGTTWQLPAMLGLSFRPDNLPSQGQHYKKYHSGSLSTTWGPFPKERGRTTVIAEFLRKAKKKNTLKKLEVESKCMPIIQKGKISIEYFFPLDYSQ